MSLTPKLCMLFHIWRDARVAREARLRGSFEAEDTYYSIKSLLFIHHTRRWYGWS